MKPPIFVYGEGYLDVFDSKETAEGYMEAIDVTNGIYEAVYDSEGWLLDITIADDNFVSIFPADPPVKKVNELRKHLQEYLKIVKPEVIPAEWLEITSFDDLVAKASQFKMK